MLSLTQLGEDAGTSTLTLKATKRTVKRLAFLNSNFCHFFFPPSGYEQLLAYYTKDQGNCQEQNAILL